MSSTQEVPQVTSEEEKEEKKEKDPSEDIAQALANFTGAPTKEQIEDWKQEHGEVFCSGFSENELLVWRPVSRQEFVNLQTQLVQGQGTQLDQEQIIVETCVLWKSEGAAASLVQKAGSLSTLHEQIMFNSNFVDPRVASALVIKL